MKKRCRRGGLALYLGRTGLSDCGVRFKDMIQGVGQPFRPMPGWLSVAIFSDESKK